MYVSVQIKDFSFFEESISDEEIDNYIAKGKASLKPLEEYLLDSSDENIFSADIIQEKLFSEIEADIFLSHAHADENEVIRLAIYLERYGLNVFIDSCVWGNVFELLRSIDDKYCWQKNSKTYNYSKRNYTTANTYMILNTALHKMIDRAELFLFLGTESSITVSDTMLGKNESVRSPWIYSELMFANQVRRIKPRQISLESFSEKYESKMTMDQMPEFDYSKPELDYTLSCAGLNSWLESIKSSRNTQHPLDCLYIILKK